MKKSFYVTNLDDLYDGFEYHGLYYNRSGTVRWKEKNTGGFTGAKFYILDHPINANQRLIIFPRSDAITPLELNEIFQMLSVEYPEHECKVVYGYPELR